VFSGGLMIEEIVVEPPGVVFFLFREGIPGD
jgi:hypothetical protein